MAILKACPSDYACRIVSRRWVGTLKERIKENPVEHSTILPCMINPSQLSNSEGFRDDQMETYEIFTLGGNHLRTAVQELLKEDASGEMASLRNVQIALYARLSKQQARRLGNRHNRQTETCPTSFMDYVRQARRLLREMTGTADIAELPGTLPDGFRKAFLEEISRDDVVSNLHHLFFRHKTSQIAITFNNLSQLLAVLLTCSSLYHCNSIFM